MLWSHLFPQFPAFVFSLLCFSGSNKHYGRAFWFCFTLTASPIIWWGCFLCLHLFLALRSRPASFVFVFFPWEMVQLCLLPLQHVEERLNRVDNSDSLTVFWLWDSYISFCARQSWRNGAHNPSFVLQIEMWPLVSSAPSATVGLFKVHLPPFLSAVIVSVYPEARTVVQMHLSEEGQSVCVRAWGFSKLSFHHNYLLSLSKEMRGVWGLLQRTIHDYLQMQMKGGVTSVDPFSLHRWACCLRKDLQVSFEISLFFSGWLHSILPFFSGNEVVGVRLDFVSNRGD